MDELKRIQDFVEATFGSHDSLLAHQIITHSAFSAMPCDVTFRDRKPFLDVTIDEKVGQTLMSGADPPSYDTLNHIRFSNGESVRFNEVLLIVPMPVGVPQAAMDAVDLSEADDTAIFSGDTLPLKI